GGRGRRGVGKEFPHSPRRRCLLVEYRQRLRGLPTQDFLREIGHCLLTGETKNAEDVALTDRLAAKGDQLIEHRLGIAQTTIRPPCDGVRGRRLQFHFLLLCDELEMLRDQIGWNAMEIEPLATAQDGDRQLLWLGRGKAENDVLRRFFESLEERVGRLLGQHVNLVDDVNLVATFRRRVANVVAQLAHVVYSTIACRVELENIEAIPA